MKKVLMLMFIAVFAAISMAAPLTVTQNFSVPDNPFMMIDGKDSDGSDKVEELNPRRDQGEDFDVTPTGFYWGGYAADECYGIEIDQNSRGGTTFDELVFKASTYVGNHDNNRDSYAYTILSSGGTNAPDIFVDMTGVDAAVNFKISDIWNGWFGGGDNGSGLPEPCNEVRATILRAMLRDTNGDWFVSDLFCPSDYEGGDLDGTIVDYTLFVNDVSWRKLPQNEIDNLNLLQGGDEIPIARDPNVTDTPDFSYVSGYGVYIWNTWDTANGQVAFTEISLLGEEVPTPGALTQNFDKTDDAFYLIDGELVSDAVTETTQSPAFTTTPTGWTWGGYAPENNDVFRIEIDRNTYIDNEAVTRTLDELKFKNNGPSTSTGVHGSYAYTIFDSNGGNQPDSSIDMSVPTAAINVKVTDFWSGWMGGGDNGSGLPGLASEVRATVLRAMIRDEAGNWYASGLFCPVAIEAPGNADKYYEGQEFEYTYNLSNTTWYEYDQGEEDVLNALASGDEIPLPRDPNLAVSPPDLTTVTGMGIYVWNQFNITSGDYGIKEISLLGVNVVQPAEDWNLDELQDLAGDWLLDTYGWVETMDTDPLAGDWVLRDGIAGEYIIDSGTMIILGNNNGWILDTPKAVFNDTTTANISVKSTFPDSELNPDPEDRRGVNIWLNGDVDLTNGTLSTNVNVHMEADNSQYVEFIADWTPGQGWPPASYVRVEGDGVTDFDDSMLDIQVTIDPNDAPLITGQVSYTISDQSGTTASGSFVMNRRSTIVEPVAHSIYSRPATTTGIIDYLDIQSGYSSSYDRAGSDGIINYLDFNWLSDRWLDVRTDPWP